MLAKFFAKKTRLLISSLKVNLHKVNKGMELGIRKRGDGWKGCIGGWDWGGRLERGCVGVGITEEDRG